MKYLFILGRNVELSTAEITSYLEKEGIKIKSSRVIDNSLLVEIDVKLPGSIINNLGGTISIGEVLAEGDFKKISRELDGKTLYMGTKNNMTYVIYNFSSGENYSSIEQYLKKRFREERLKATEKNLNGFLELQDGRKVRISKGLIDEEFFIFENCFGKIYEKSDYDSIEKRDMEKPERREALAISPRLSKIMINLSKVKKDEVILDPFCGVGSILQEALLQGINVIGVDNETHAINGARKNLEWGKFNKYNYKLILDDSRKVKFAKADVMVSEPNLGEILKNTINEGKAQLILRDYETLMIAVLNNVKKNINGLIVFSAPKILLFNKRRVSCNIEHITKSTGLKLINKYEEYRIDQVVGRDIFVLRG